MLEARQVGFTVAVRVHGHDSSSRYSLTQNERPEEGASGTEEGKKVIRRAWGMGILGFVLVGLLGSEVRGQVEVPKLRVGMLKISSFVPLHVAAVKGYYREEGLTDLELVPAGGGQELFQILQAGRIQFAAGNAVSAIQGKAGGFNWSIVTLNETSRAQAPDSGTIFVRKDSGLRSLKDLEGKTIATNNLNNIVWLTGMVTFKKRGADVNKVRWTELPFPQMPDALLKGQVDAVATVEPFTTVMMGTGKATILAHNYVETMPNVVLGIVLARDDWTKANPKTTQAFVRATRRGIDYLNQSGDAEARKMVVEFTNMKPELADKMLLTVWTYKLNVAEFQTLADYMLEFKLLSKRFDVGTILHKLATTY